MYILGISGGVLAGNQDASACLLRDGEVVAAAEEERLLGIKHANAQLPRRAIRACLDQAGIEIHDIAAVGAPGRTYRDWQRILTDYFKFHFGHVPPIHVYDHHTAHAASAYHYSGHDDALVLTMDFSGDRTCTALYRGRGESLNEVTRVGRPNSLGVFYAMMTQYLGFGKDDEEYKVMGLASFGEPKYDLSDILKVDGDGYALNLDYVKLGDAERPAPSKQEALFRDLPLPEPHRLRGTPVRQYHKDVAASAQHALEEAVLHLLARATANEPRRLDLCLAGGVALNCVLNQKIRAAGLFNRVFVPPHASDAGLALGCAALLGLELGAARPQRITHCRWGPSYGDAQIERVLRTCAVPYARPADLCATVVEDLAAGRVVGWFQGPMEFGPRALGGRSILADCRNPEMQQRVNVAVKFREGFRPFAPSILAERAGDYLVDATPSPFMTMTFDVRPDRHSQVPAVTHVDGTARAQTVDESQNPLYHRLLREMEAQTSVPVLLNTSMNVNSQPIVDDPRRALALFYSTGLAGMALGSFYLRK
ncbi:MAG: carbamoyltransferase C-terminal domain-containing protein [Planctomycetota bacterium]